MDVSMSYRMLFAAAMLFTAACASGSQQYGSPAPSPAPVGARTINVTSALIERLNARSAWDIIERQAPRILNSQRPRLDRRYAVERPMVVLDGATVNDFSVLRDISALSVRMIRILHGSDGYMLYGSQAAGGVIEIISR